MNVGGLPYAGSDAVHDLWVGAGVLAALIVFGYEVRRRGVADPRIWVVAASCLLCGGLAARLGTWWYHLAPADNAPVWEHWVYGNRSIIGGLAGAWLGVHLGKRLIGYRPRTGDLFAPAVALGLAVGRVGCLLTELPGTPTGGEWGIVLDRDQAMILGGPIGVGLHPSFGYEIAFHLLAFVLLWTHRDRFAPGDLFVLYVGGYAVVRFGLEFLRGNEAAWAGLSRSQWVIAAFAIPLGWRCRRAWATRRPSSALAGDPPTLVQGTQP